MNGLIQKFIKRIDNSSIRDIVIFTISMQLMSIFGLVLCINNVMIMGIIITLFPIFFAFIIFLIVFIDANMTNSN